MSDEKKIATAIKRKDGNGVGYVFRVQPPMHDQPWGDSKPQEFRHVWVSAASVPYSGPETYIFGCQESGEVIDWGELEGSYRGGLSHEQALEAAGYTVEWAGVR